MDAIERLGAKVRQERPDIIAAVVAAGAMLQSGSRSIPRADGRDAVEFEPTTLADAAARVAEAAEPLFSALRFEEASLRRGRVDPWDEAATSLEEFVWLCWALAEFPPTVEPRSATRELVAEFLVDACRIALEVVCLMREGFYGGARARWRSIHELVVFGEVMARYGDPAAERFRANDVQQKKKIVGVLEKYGPEWDMTQIAPEESAAVDRALADARNAYGEDFGDSDYGWAADFVSPKLPHSAGGNPVGSRRPGKRWISFADLEDAVGASRWRAHYALASALVHARLPSGPAILGNDSLSLRLVLVDPGDGHVGALTALSLCALTQVLMEVSADPSDKADKLRAWFASVAVEQVRQELDRKFSEVEDRRASDRARE